MELKRVADGVHALGEDGTRIGYVSCSPIGERAWSIDHTVVSPDYQGQGLAAKLIRDLVEMARDEGIKLRPVCSYAVAQFERHKEYADVLLSH
ncbi:hypothetical protein C7445_101271 [Alicyclobacillus sacchari]|uniref:Uncharacterized protein n=1 Tax=Alicyclobacillus sacchari TaxID=392010 RepID=A0A4R8LU40_9BACL|nr:GNAT family N-acetyltransferase [Alicyclobacillus sacchari]TDY51270.1 hypothetical protein C7445_101271 [Alicyclobacillus sacchari]GMA56561.1 N-acetyltransferase [Alicyclobacillus sacchari]